MPTPFSGGCLCGAIRYECSIEPLADHLQGHCPECQLEQRQRLCHCADCPHSAP